MTTTDLNTGTERTPETSGILIIFQAVDIVQHNDEVKGPLSQIFKDRRSLCYVLQLRYVNQGVTSSQYLKHGMAWSLASETRRDMSDKIN
jgi:hypothetical protein